MSAQGRVRGFRREPLPACGALQCLPETLPPAGPQCPVQALVSQLQAGPSGIAVYAPTALCTLSIEEEETSWKWWILGPSLTPGR